MMYINILHRIGKNEDLEVVKFQQDTAHKFGLKTTLLLNTNALYFEEAVTYAIEQSEKYNDEIGLSLHGLTGSGLGEKFGIKDTMVYLMPFDRKIKLLSFVIELFKEKTGYYPKSVASYVLDARTLNWLHENYSQIKAAVTNCFEEGAKMFPGNQNQWYLFSDGGPWGAYYPSKVNSLIPAKNKDEFSGIVGLPHLNRDMLMAITSRDDLFSSHPTNVVRAKAYNSSEMECNYMYRFIDEWLNQIEFNGFTYYNVFVSPVWLTDASMLDEAGEFSRNLYLESMEYLGDKVNKKLALAYTMSEFAEWYRGNVKFGSCEVNKWKDLICGSKRQMYWYVDSDFRVTLDANIGGAICDLRPYAGKLVRNLGNDTPNLQNMNYPFLISGELRGGVHDGSIHTFKVSVNGQMSDIVLKRTEFELSKNKNGNQVVRVKPITLNINGVKLKIESNITFSGDGKILIKRKLLECSDNTADIKITEYHCGCYGTNNYPEDMRGITLTGGNKAINYEYLGRSEIFENLNAVCATIPQLNCNVILESENAVLKITEGWMFRPFYYLQAEKSVKEGEVLTVCLKISQIGL